MLMLMYDVTDESEVEFEENGGSGLPACKALENIDESRVLGCAGIRTIVPYKMSLMEVVKMIWRVN
jgi:hypothetical protein